MVCGVHNLLEGILKSVIKKFRSKVRHEPNDDTSQILESGWQRTREWQIKIHTELSLHRVL